MLGKNKFRIGKSGQHMEVSTNWIDNIRRWSMFRTSLYIYLSP